MAFVLALEGLGSGLQWSCAQHTNTGFRANHSCAVIFPACLIVLWSVFNQEVTWNRETTVCFSIGDSAPGDVQGHLWLSELACETDLPAAAKHLKVCGGN